MVSKTQKKTTLKVCNYVYLQSKKKDRKCNRNCRGSFCKFHNKSTFERKAKYYKKIKLVKDNKSTEEIIQKIKNGKDIDIGKYRLKLGKLETNYKYHL